MINMLALLFVLGLVCLACIVIATWRDRRYQRKIQRAVAQNRLGELKRKALREEDRQRWTTVREWEKEFKTLDATQYFNPRRGSRLAKLDCERHDYRAVIQECAIAAGAKSCRLFVSDGKGREVEVRVVADNPEARAYRECIITDLAGRIIGGWQLAHEEIPYEFTAASVNLGYVYSEPLDLPTMVPLGYDPNPIFAGWVTTLQYIAVIEGAVRGFAEKYLEENFSAIFPKGPPGGEVAFKKTVNRIHVCPDLPGPELTPEQRASELRQRNKEFRRRHPEYYRGVPANESLVEAVLKELQRTRKLPPIEQTTATNAPAEEQEAWIKQRIKELDEQRAKISDAAKTSTMNNPVPAPAATKSDDVIIIALGYHDGTRFQLTSKKTLASMLLERGQLEAAVRAGKTLSSAEKKKLVIAQFLLGTPGEEPLIHTCKLNLEDVKNVLAIGEFTFGDILGLLTSYGSPPEGMTRFFDGIRSGEITLEEAEQFLRECKEWDGIKAHASLSQQEFFATKLAADVEARKSNPSNN